jgi:penicillin-binding protein 1A
VPFVAPPGIRWVRIDRATGKQVFGVFPTENDPKSPVIWEAFQPQTEQRRNVTANGTDPYNEDQRQQRLAAAYQAALQERQLENRQAAGGATTTDSPPTSNGLPTQNGVQ